MSGAITVLVLASLALPILLVLMALMFDALVVVWFVARMTHDEWWPKVKRMSHVHWPIIPAHH